MTVLLDTNICIAVMNGDPPSVRERFKRARRFNQPLHVSNISLFELWFGIANSARAAANTERLNDFCGMVNLIPFDDDDARSAAYLRSELMQSGGPLSAYDLLIAAQALRRDLLLVTADRDFSLVKQLRVETWES